MYSVTPPQQQASTDLNGAHCRNPSTQTNSLAMSMFGTESVNVYAGAGRDEEVLVYEKLKDTE